MTAAAPGARIVQLGASAGPEASVPSAVVRGKQLDVLGYSNFGLPRAEFVDGYQRLVGLANDGKIRVDVDRYTLAEVAAAWGATVNGQGKAVICPQTDGA
jgi:hypothetical protein